MTRQDGRLRTQGRPIKLLTRGDMFFPIAMDPKDIPSSDLDDDMQKFQAMIDEGIVLKTAITAAGLTATQKATARKQYDQWKAMRKMELRDDVFKLLLDELDETFDFKDLKDSMDKRCNVDFDKYRKNFIDNADENLDFLEPKIWMDWKREMFVSQIKKAGHLGRLNNKVYTQTTENYVVIPVRTGANLADYWPEATIVLDDPFATMANAYKKPATTGIDLVYLAAAGAVEAYFTLAGYPGAPQIDGVAGSLKIRTRTVKKRGRMTTEKFKRDIRFNERDPKGFCSVDRIFLNYQNATDSMTYGNVLNVAIPQDSVGVKIVALIKNLDNAYNKCFKAELKKLHSQEPYLYPLKLTGGVPHRMYQGPVGELGASGDPFNPDTDLIDGRRKKRRSSSKSKRKRLSRRSKRKSRGSKRKSRGSKRKSTGSKKKSKKKSRGSRKRRVSRRH